jgi:hypothetical protein
MGGKVGSALACYGSSQGSNPDISQKYKMDNLGKGVASTLKPAKKYTNKNKIKITKSLVTADPFL